MTADEEDNYHVAQANSELDEEGHFVNANVSGRYLDETSEYPKTVFEYMDVSPSDGILRRDCTDSVPAERRANRALMGSNCSVRQCRF